MQRLGFRGHGHAARAWGAETVGDHIFRGFSAFQRDGHGCCRRETIARVAKALKPWCNIPRFKLIGPMLWSIILWYTMVYYGISCEVWGVYALRG